MIVADIMGQEYTIRVITMQLVLDSVKRFVTQCLSVSTFHTALDGTIVFCAPHAITVPVQTQSTTHLGRRILLSQVLYIHNAYQIGILV